MSEIDTIQPTVLGAADPTGGRLLAWAQAASAANALARSLTQTAFVPAAMKSVGDATAAIIMGDELGLSPLAALRSIYVVHGTPALYARSMVALAQSQGHEIWTTVSTPTKVVVCGRRRGSDHIEQAEWTIERARRAGYTSNKKYDSAPQEMLYAKAASEIARRIAADTLAGVPYSVEDLELEQPATATVARSASGTRRVSRKAIEPAEPDLPQAGPEMMTEQQNRLLHALLGRQGITDREIVHTTLSALLGVEIESTKDLTKDQASRAIDHLQVEAEEPPLDGEPS